jgi:hypothetical protein
MADDYGTMKRLDSDIKRLESIHKATPGLDLSNQIGGLQTELQSLINSNLPKPDPLFPPTIHDR